MPLTPWYEARLHNKGLRNEDFTIERPYASLHSAEPVNGAAELAGYSYRRVPISFGRSEGPLASNDRDVVWEDLPPGPVTWVGLWSAPQGGNMMAYGLLSAAKVLNAGDRVVMGVGEFVILLGGNA